MRRDLIYVGIFFIILLSGIAIAEFQPYGNINLNGVFGIFNAVSINSTEFYQDGNKVLDTSGVNWSYLQNYPAECPTGSYLTKLNDSVTCTSPSEFLLLSGGNMTGPIGNLSQTFISNGEDLVAYWSFDENTGTKLYDSSRNTNYCNMSSVPSFEIGRFGSALEFDGTDDYLTCGQDSSLETLETITISLWAKANNPTDASDEGLVGFTGTNDPFYLVIYKEKIRFRLENSSGTAKTITSPVLDWDTSEFYHITARYNGSHLSVYRNGELKGTPTTQNGDITALVADLNIGRRQSANYDFNGTIDEVKIYNRSLSLSEINALYLLGRTEAPTGHFLPVTGGTMDNNLIMTSGKKVCLDGATCNHYIYFNGTHTVIE